MFGAAHGAVAASYPKTFPLAGPTEFCRKVLADGGTRRTYTGAVDQYVDAPSTGTANWANGGPTPALITAGWTLKFRVEATDLEAPSSGADICRLRIAAVSQNVGAANPVSGALPSAGVLVAGDDVRSIDAAPSGGQTVNGAITFGNYFTVNTGNTSHTGDFILFYSYGRS